MNVQAEGKRQFHCPYLCSRLHLAFTSQFKNYNQCTLCKKTQNHFSLVAKFLREGEVSAQNATGDIFSALFSTMHQCRCIFSLSVRAARCVAHSVSSSSSSLLFSSLSYDTQRVWLAKSHSFFLTVASDNLSHSLLACVSWRSAIVAAERGGEMKHESKGKLQVTTLCSLAISQLKETEQKKEEEERKSKRERKK